MESAFLSVVLVPFAPFLPVLALRIVVYQFSADIGYVGPRTRLYYEMIPQSPAGTRGGDQADRYGIAFFIVNRLDRFRVFLIGLVISTARHLAFWRFAEYSSPDYLLQPVEFCGRCRGGVGSGATHLRFRARNKMGAKKGRCRA